MNLQRTALLRGALAASLLSLSASAAQPAFTNPVLPADYPDPSVIRVGEDYWATATTSEWAPLFPILHSRDLVHWQEVGAVFQRRPDWSVGNYWAPEISERGGKFYVYYVGRKKGGPLSVAVAMAPKPEGPWTDHGPLVSQAAGSIDPMTISDDDGQLYLIWKEDGNSRKLPTPLWIQKLSDDGLKLLGEPKEILRNDTAWERNLIEGPFVKRRGPWFYLFYSGNACCGRACDYALGVARAKSPLGPWEKNPANPILAGNNDWRCPGHGTIVSDAQGRDFLLYHAYDAKTFVYVGRQGLLDEIIWNTDGWPTINQGRGPSSHTVSPGHREHTVFVDDFRSAKLKPEWQWPQASEPSVTLTAGELLLRPPAEHARDVLGAVLAVKTSSGNYTAETKLNVSSLANGVTAGLSAFGDKENALGISVRDKKLSVWRRQKRRDETIASADLPAASEVSLRIIASDGHRFRFAVSSDGTTWTSIGDAVDVEGDYLPPWDRGIRVALVAGGAENAAAKFRSLRLTGN
jgi:xylan 1,4-beta-xylosidase